MRAYISSIWAKIAENGQKYTFSNFGMHSARAQSLSANLDSPNPEDFLYFESYKNVKYISNKYSLKYENQSY